MDKSINEVIEISVDTLKQVKTNDQNVVVENKMIIIFATILIIGITYLLFTKRS